MEIDALRNKVREECERCFAPRPLNVTDNAKPPNTVKDTELSKHVIEIAKVNIKNIFYKKFNDGIISISDKKEIIDLENISYKEKIEKFTNSTLNGYASKRFLNLFKDGLITSEEQHKRIIAATKFDSRTIREFLKGKTIPDEKTLDLFSTFIQFAGWNKFKFWIKNQPNSDNSTSISPKISFQSNKFSTERLEIAGATIIDEDFIEEIKTRNFSMAEFYTAMYDNDCQWFGITQGWDVERKNFKEIKGKLRSVFEFRRTFKISLVVHGNGGVGKTCFLRRLANELHKEQSFTILWLNNKTNIFLEVGLKIIEENLDTNFLIVIEDWEKIFRNIDSAVVQKFLEQTSNLQNIRIIVGDRNIDKDYMNFLNNDIEPLLLSTEENSDIIEKIVEKHTEWWEVTQKLFENQENYNSSLFLLLFIIAHINKEELKRGSYDLSEARTIFKNIIESDFKFIAQKDEGLAKAFYYWGCLYSKYRIYITYETLLKIADYFNGDNKKSNFFSRWDIDEPYLNKLKLYITTRKIEIFKEKRNLILFNHDVFCDFGFSRIHFKKWDKFSDAIILDLMDIIIEGDNYCASQFLDSMLLNKAEIFKNDEEKLELIEKVLLKEDVGYQYQIKVHRANIILQSEKWRMGDDFSVQDLLRYANKEIVLNFSNKIFESSDWKIDFMHLQHYCWHNADFEIKRHFANKILNDHEDLFFFNIGIDNLLEYACEETATEFSNLSLINFIRIGFGTYELSAFLDYATTDVVNHFCHEVIMAYFIENYIEDTYFIQVVFRSASKDIIGKFYQEYLTNDRWKSLDVRIVEFCLHYCDAKMSTKFANRIIVEQSENWEIHSYLFECILQYASKEIAQNFSKKVLINSTIEAIERGMVLKCLRFSTDEVRDIFCQQILLSEKWKFLDSVITRFCIDSASTTIRNKFANSILSGDIWELANNNIVIKCIKNSSPKIRKQFINRILSEDNWKTVESCIINSCIENSVEKAREDFSTEILIGNDWKFCDVSTIEHCFKFVTINVFKDFCNKIIQEGSLTYPDIYYLCASRYKKFQLDELLREIDQK